jgi:hypothetical protein
MITGFSLIILAFLPLMFAGLFFRAIEAVVLSPYPGYVPVDYFGKCMDLIYHARNTAVLLLCGIILAAGMIVPRSASLYARTRNRSRVPTALGTGIRPDQCGARLESERGAEAAAKGIPIPERPR